MNEPITSTDESHTAGEEKCELGVLFVHGIGEQREGETLLSFGEPVIEHIRRMATRSDEDRMDLVRATDAILLPSRRFERCAARVRLRVSLPAHRGEPSINQQWLLSEAWWGEQVLSPHPMMLIGWLMTRGPWVALLHVFERAVDVPQASFSWLWRFLRLVAGLVLWVPLVAVLQSGLLLMALLALVPLPRVGRTISAFLLRVSGVLGDSYVLVKHEAQRAAIVSRVREALTLLDRTCERVAVIAHSQGTAVAYDALRSGTVKPALFVTFGSGLPKLEMLILAERLWHWGLLFAGWIVPLFFTSAVLWLRHRGDPDIAETWPGWAVTLKAIAVGGENEVVQAASLPTGMFLTMAFAALVAALWSIVGARKLLRGRAQQSSQQMVANEWLDIRSSHDPVPHGTLNAALDTADIRSERVTNRQSFGSDHTAYFDNRAEFVPMVVEALCAAAKLPLGGKAYDSAMRRARAHHSLSVRVLSWTRPACLAAIPWCGYWYWENLQDVASNALHAAGEVPKSFWDVVATFEGISSVLQYVSGNALSREQVAALLLLVIIGVGVWIWRYVFSAVWATWDRLMVHEALDGQEVLPPVIRSVLFPVIVGLGVLPLIFVWPVVNGLGIESTLIYVTAWLIALGLFGAFVWISLMLAVAMWSQRSWIKEKLIENIHDATEEDIDIISAGGLLLSSALVIPLFPLALYRFTPPYEPPGLLSIAAWIFGTILVSGCSLLVVRYLRIRASYS